MEKEEGPAGVIALEDTRVQRCQGIDSRTVRKFLLFAATVLLLANAAPPAAQPDRAPSSPQSPRAAHDTVKPCPADKPLGGHIQVDSEWNSNGCRGSRHTLLRFLLVSSGPWCPQLYSGFDAPMVQYEMSSTGCSGVTVNGEETCNAPDGRKVGSVTLGKLGPQGFMLDPNADGYLHFSPLKPEIRAPVLLRNTSSAPEVYTTFLPGPNLTRHLEMLTATSTPLECVGPRASSKGSWLFDFGGLSIGPDYSSLSTDYGHPFLVNVPPSDCSKPTGAASDRECITHADRHAVIPFSGESIWKSPKASDRFYTGILSAKIHWEICCGCGAAPPCGGEGQKRGFVYISPPHGHAELHRDPSMSSPVVPFSPPYGSRQVYTDVRDVGGTLWYYVTAPGMTPGWTDETSCGRPRPPPAGRPVTLESLGLEGAHPVAAMTSAGNG